MSVRGLTPCRQLGPYSWLIDDKMFCNNLPFKIKITIVLFKVNKIVPEAFGINGLANGKSLEWESQSYLRIYVYNLDT